MNVTRHWRLYECADCEDQDAPHQEVRYDGMPTMCVHCGSVHSFVDAGPIDVAREAVSENEQLRVDLARVRGQRDALIEHEHEMAAEIDRLRVGRR